MYGLDKNIDLAFLKGREIIQIAIGVHQVIFAFDDDVTISVENHFQYLFNDGSSEWRPGAKHVAAKTVQLLGSVVEEVLGQENGTLELTFSNGDRLVITDENKNCEAYNITRRGQTIVV
jgi:hypothetical protein